MTVYVATAAVCAADAASALEMLERWEVPAAWLGPGRPGGEPLSAAAERWAERLVYHHACFADPAAPRWNLAATDEAWRRRSLEEATEHLRRAAGAGSPFYSLHGGYLLSSTVGPGGEALGATTTPRRALDQLCRSLDRLASTADNLGLPLLVENGAGPHAVWHDPETIGRTLERLGAPPLGLLLDVAHLLLFCQAKRWEPEPVLGALKPYVKAVELSRTDGRRDRHAAPVEGGIELELARLAGGDHLPLVLEARGLERGALAEALALIEAVVRRQN